MKYIDFIITLNEIIMFQLRIVETRVEIVGELENQALHFGCLLKARFVVARRDGDCWPPEKKDPPNFYHDREIIYLSSKKLIIQTNS